jgi:hypothetical protein
MVAFEQLGAERVLQALDLSADSGLSDVQLFCSSAIAPLPGNFIKGNQLPEIKIVISKRHQQMPL